MNPVFIILFFIGLAAIALIIGLVFVPLMGRIGKHIYKRMEKNYHYDDEEDNENEEKS